MLIEARVTPDPKVGAIAWAGLCARATGMWARACDGLMRMIFVERPCARGRGVRARGMVSARGLWARARGETATANASTDQHRFPYNIGAR
jgi:hypothetical protein